MPTTVLLKQFICQQMVSFLKPSIIFWVIWVLLSIPSLIFYFIPTISFDVSVLLILRVLRVFRFFRLIHAVPRFARMATNFARAMRQSYAVFVGLLVMIVVFSMIGTSLFKDIAPEYFSSVLIVGCIIGMSLLNSIFVDAMVSDNNNDVEDKLNSIESKLAELQKKLDK